MKISLLVLPILITGCAGSTAWLATATPEELVAHYSPKCEAFGFTFGTEGFANCIQQQIANDQNKNAQLANVGQNLNTINQGSQTTTTDCHRVGNSVQCTSY